MTDLESRLLFVRVPSMRSHGGASDSRHPRTRERGARRCGLALAALLAFASAPGAADASGPSVELSQQAALPGASVQVSGSGFDGSCGVSLFFDDSAGELLGSAAVLSGDFTADVVVPVTALVGDHRVVARGRRASGQEFCVTPSDDSAAADLQVDDSPYLIRFKSRAFVPAPGFELTAIEDQRNGSPSDLVHFLVQFVEQPTLETQQGLVERGLTLGTPLSGRAYFASSTVARLDDLPSIEALRWVGPYLASDKIDAALLAGNIPAHARTDAGGVALTLELHADVDIEDAPIVVNELGGQIVVFEGLPALLPITRSVTAMFDASAIPAVAARDEVSGVQAVDPPLEEQNDGNRAAANVAPLQGAPFNLSGAGVTAFVYDGGQVDAHVDFGARVLSNDGSAISDHATHVAGTLGGSGANSAGLDSAGNPNGGTVNQWAGMAPQVNLRSSGTTGGAAAFYDGGGGDLFFDFVAALAAGIDLANMSLGNNVVRSGAPCAQLGDYTNTSILVDAIVAGAPLILFESAGNERTSGSPCSATGFGTISSPATAKNSIAVGAINSNDASITAFTSFGPTDDGRLKPDVTAPGCQSSGDFAVTSSSFIDLDPDGPGPLRANGVLDVGETQNAYVTKCGTSMASPTAAGAGALVVEQWQRINGAGTRPTPRAMKALFVHTSNDLGNPGPDFRFGWGAVDAQAAVQLVIDDAAATSPLINDGQVMQGQTQTFSFDSNGGGELRFTLAWDDLPAARISAVSLVNDLDLRIVDPTGATRMPLVLNPAAGSQNNNAAPGNDSRNNVEMVVADAIPGTWMVRVTGTTVTAGAQAFTVILPQNPAEQPIADLFGRALALPAPIGNMNFEGVFRSPVTLDLSSSTLRLPRLLDEAGTELVSSAPVTLMTPLPGATPNHATFISLLFPGVVVDVTHLGANDYLVVLVPFNVSIDRPTSCGFFFGSSSLTTSVVIDDGGNPPVVASTTETWLCFGSTVLTF